MLEHEVKIVRDPIRRARGERAMAHLLVSQIDVVEHRFDDEKVSRWLRDNWTLTLYANAVYLAVIFLGRRWMKDRKPYSLRKALTLWNTGLAVFSIMGFLRFYPDLQAGVLENGFTHSVCNNHLMLNPPHNLWALLFILSKAVEFGDTIFIVLRKTPLNFLHWYHHISVFVYCTYSVSHRDPTAEWFGTLNLFVHSVMYSYYVLKAFGVRIPRSVAQSITLLQLAQFVMGLTVLGTVYRVKTLGGPCKSHDSVLWYGVLMYGSYMVLFGNFFYRRYLRPSK